VCVNDVDESEFRWSSSPTLKGLICTTLCEINFFVFFLFVRRLLRNRLRINDDLEIRGEIFLKLHCVSDFKLLESSQYLPLEQEIFYKQEIFYNG